MPKLDDVAYVRLGSDLKQELLREAALHRKTLSDVVRGRLMADAVDDIAQNAMYSANRGLTTQAIVNAIYQKLEPDKKVRHLTVQHFKRELLEAEAKRMRPIND